MTIKNQKLSCLLVQGDAGDRAFFLDTFYNVIPEARCYAVTDDQGALSVLLQDEFTPDIIFLDLNLPKMSGLELLQTLKRIEKYRHIPVVIHSGDCSEEQITAARSLGALGVYSKAGRSALEMILRKYLAPLQNKTTALQRQPFHFDH